MSAGPFIGVYPDWAGGRPAHRIGAMTLDLPSITVVTPSFNQGRFLERTILSVLDQDYPALEYFVMDGGSTDDSVDIIRRYAHRLDHWASQPDGGQTAAINTGWRMAHGEILCWLNSDDYYLPGTLRFVGEYMREHPEEWVVYGSWEAVDDAGRRLNYAGRPFAHSRMILSQNCIPQPAAFIRRAAIDEVGYLDETLHYTMDLDLFMRIAGYQTPRYVSRPLAAATVHADAKTIRDRQAMARERYQVRRRYARPWETPLVLLQPAASFLFAAVPVPVRNVLNRLRPRRTFDAPLPKQSR